MKTTFSPSIVNQGRIPELDGVRGLAISMVLIHHFFSIVTRPGSTLAYALVPLRMAWSGVDLFFVLSGFLIGGILLDARESSNYFQVFYTRRFFRIVPIYAVLLLSVGLTMYLSKVGFIGKYEEIFAGQLSWVYYPVFLQNVGMTLHNVWGTAPLAPTWSLAVEEQFYLTLPLAIRLLDRRALIRFALAAIIGAPVLRTYLFYRNPANFLAWYTLMPCRVDALLLGVVGAIALRDPNWRAWLLGKRRFAMLVIAVMFLGLAYLCWRAPFYWDGLMATAGFTWLAFTYFAILLYVLLYPDGLISRPLRWTWLRELGVVAYGTYLFHELFLSMFFRRIPWLRSRHDVALSVFVLTISICFCRLSWVYFEKPLVKIGHRTTYLFGPGGVGKDLPVIPAEGG